MHLDAQPDPALVASPDTADDELAAEQERPLKPGLKLLHASLQPRPLLALEICAKIGREADECRRVDVRRRWRHRPELTLDGVADPRQRLVHLRGGRLVHPRLAVRPNREAHGTSATGVSRAPVNGLSGRRKPSSSSSR